MACEYKTYASKNMHECTEEQKQYLEPSTQKPQSENKRPMNIMKANASPHERPELSLIHI